MKKLTVAAKTENLYAVLDFIAQSLDVFPNESKTAITMAAEEIFVNIASYAYEKRDGDVDICLTSDDNAVVIEFSDNGIAFNPLDRPEKKRENTIDDVQIGGIGILMVKQLIDIVSYRREGNKNILTIEKKARGI